MESPGEGTGGRVGKATSAGPRETKRHELSSKLNAPAMRSGRVDTGPTVILINKPYGVLCQFTGDGSKPTLKDFVPVPGVYPAGRLDADSEGLVVLTGDGALQARIADPRFKLEKGYWVQVEGIPRDADLAPLRRGIALADGPARPAKARLIEAPPGLWERDPPIRV